MTTATIDPRIRARRISVSRAAGRRRLNRLLLATAVLALGAAAVATTFTPALDVDQVQVRGMYRTSVDAITGAAGVHPGDPMVWFDTGAAEAAVARLPWVEHVSVHRQWPGTVHITVSEREPAAALADPDGGWLVADGEGHVVAATREAPPDLIHLDGLVAAGAPGDVLEGDVLGPLAVAAAVPEVMAPQVASIGGTADAVEVRLTAGGVVQLGDGSDAGEKLLAAAAVLGAVAPGCVERLDVRLPTAPALVRAEGCS